MNDMREALRNLISISEDGFIESRNSGETRRWETDMLQSLKAAKKVLAAPKWTFPDEDTPEEAAVWGYHWKQWFLTHYRHASRWGHVEAIVLARTGEGQPTPEETRQIMERADED